MPAFAAIVTLEAYPAATEWPRLHLVRRKHRADPLAGIGLGCSSSAVFIVLLRCRWAAVRRFWPFQAGHPGAIKRARGSRPSCRMYVSYAPGLGGMQKIREGSRGSVADAG
jgi:hypothetical protein